MCGINGFNFIDRKLIKSMNNSLRHRGPDAGGILIKKGVSLGHRRLSIIDLSKKASQPMKYSHKGNEVVIVFNGEIYNFLEIKKELEKKGYKFKSHSDTEVILASYIEWGQECVKRFNGMWAFCVYDIKKNILFLSRDRIGKKPIYYHIDNKKFIFSSELKGILKHDINRGLSKEAIDLYFSLGFIPSPYSVYKNIFKIEARQNLIYDLKKKKVDKYYYYRYPEYAPKKDKTKLITEGKALLEEATKKRLISDVPLGAFLSGGLDSSAVVYFMKKEIGDKLNTFSIGFEGKYDESKEAKKIAKEFQTNHHHRYFHESDFKRILKEIFYYYDEPLADASIFPTFFLSEFAKKGLTVALSGDGGDEVFGGYPRYSIGRQMEFLREIPPILRKCFLAVIPKKRIPLVLKRFREGIRLSLLKKEELYSEAREEVYKPEVYKKLVLNKFSEALKLSKDNLTEAIIIMDRYFNTLADNYLVKVDRASMANSLEVRSPFLDYRLIEFASKIPVEHKSSLSQGKILFREMMKDILPREIVNKKKTGFTPPIEDWLLKSEYDKELKEALEKLYAKRLISGEWREFYLKEVFNNKEQLHKVYRVRLYLFYKWAKYWKI